jgi:hypothetical protein
MMKRTLYLGLAIAEDVLAVRANGARIKRATITNSKTALTDECFTARPFIRISREADKLNCERVSTASGSDRVR